MTPRVASFAGELSFTAATRNDGLVGDQCQGRLMAEYFSRRFQAVPMVHLVPLWVMRRLTSLVRLTAAHRCASLIRSQSTRPKRNFCGSGTRSRRGIVRPSVDGVGREIPESASRLAHQIGCLGTGNQPRMPSIHTDTISDRSTHAALSYPFSARRSV